MSDSSAGTTMRERAQEPPGKLWLLINANRVLLTGALMVGLFVVIVLVGVADAYSLQAVMRNSTRVERLFQSLIGSLISGVTLVVTISQLIIS